jgi:hypothetical protein
MAETSGMAELRRSYPFEKGLTKGTQTQEGRQMNLTPRDGSNVPQRLRKGL